MLKVVTMQGVREYSEGYVVELCKNESNGRLVIRALNEGRNAETLVDVLDVLNWVNCNPAAVGASA